MEGYNRDDCASTFHLRSWLEDIRRDLINGGAVIERPGPGDGQALEELSERQEMIRALGDRIAGDVLVAAVDRSPEQHARWVLANILDWHRREEKATWWEFFRLRDSSVDELIDERQALAQFELAISHAGPDLVLLGDPQQLDQPTQGAHPEGTAVSALGHLLGDRQTIEEDRGLFLEETWRLHPEICGFTSEAFYEGKLRSRPGLDGQNVISSGPMATKTRRASSS